MITETTFDHLILSPSLDDHEVHPKEDAFDDFQQREDIPISREIENDTATTDKNDGGRVDNAFDIKESQQKAEEEETTTIDDMFSDSTINNGESGAGEEAREKEDELEEFVDCSKKEDTTVNPLDTVPI